MPRKKDEAPTYDYNLYKIPVEKHDAFVSFLEERRFEEIPLKNELIKNNCGFSFKLMFCDKDNQKGSPWVKMLSACSECDLTQIIKIYGAAFICKSKTSCYVVSYGNAHFYLSEYCEYNFGIEIAERLINLDSVKAQQNVSNGGKTSKMHVDYINAASLSYHGGEIPTYIKGKSINAEEWGYSISCGTSAQFKWREKPTEIGRKLAMIDAALNVNTTISLPRLTALDDDIDAEKIASLFQQLAKAIDEYDITKRNTDFVNVPSFYMVGTKLVQNDSVGYKLSCNQKHKDYDGELSINSIKTFILDKKLNIYHDIKDIKLSVEYGNDQWTPYKPLVEYLEFVTSDNFCLRNAKWCSFNNAYLERVMQDVEMVQFINHNNDIFSFSTDSLIKYAKEKGVFVESEKQPYETYYNLKISENLNALLIHPNSSPVDETDNHRYRYEICDFVSGDKLYFVKIGAPADFAYAVDQAQLTLSKIENGHGKIIVSPGEEIRATEFHLLLIFDNRKTVIGSWRDIFSINFLIHLIGLKQELNNTNIALIIDFVYQNN